MKNGTIMHMTAQPQPGKYCKGIHIQDVQPGNTRRTTELFTSLTLFYNAGNLLRKFDSVKQKFNEIIRIIVIFHFKQSDFQGANLFISSSHCYILFSILQKPEGKNIS